MITFLALGALMVLGALALILWPVWRRSQESRARGQTLIATIVLLPLLTVGGYYLASNWVWNEAGRGEVARQNMLAVAEDMGRQFDLTNDASGWAYLGDWYMERGEYERALHAFTRVTQIQPNDMLALIFGGMVADALGEYATAQSFWRHALTLGPPAEVRTLLEDELRRLDILVPPSAQQVPPVVQQGGSTTVPNSTTVPDVSAESIEIEISLSAELQDRVAPGAVLYLFAHTNPERAGPPAAARQISPQQLPGTFHLGPEDNVMLPGQPFVAAGGITITARISLQGDALERSGDLYGELVLNPGENQGQIVIDRVVP